MEPASSKCVEKAVDFVLYLTIRHVGYIFYYKENVSELNSLVEKLILERESLEHRVDKAEDNLGITESNVATWLQKVDKTRTETEKFQDDKGHAKTRFSSGLFHYLRNRHRLGRKAKKMAVDVKLLIDEKFDGVSYQQKPTSMHVALFNDGYVEFASRKDTIKSIMEKLEDSTVRMIGVHGPGGVGKSTLIKEIVKKAQVKKLFSMVVIVEITNNPNLRKIQEEIAYVLGLNLEGEGETVRADRLRRRLKKERKNTLVVLDDLWDRIDLNKIGIPFDDDSSRLAKGKSPGDYNRDDDSSRLKIQDMKGSNFTMVKKGKSPGDYNGCKILLTSRDKKVLSDKMDVESVFYVGELNGAESLMLFKEEAGIHDEMFNFKQDIVKYCAGIPMAIVTVGRALRKKSESMWEATLEKLKKEELSGVQKSMEIYVKMSYDHLEILLWIGYT
ncbi:putative P-loop containing nucleoside triphosphate hydrolase [Medicago truncatula]|uniref:Putative P-loop containing nucleoside triphosphate hydrolase n=1 Tax=Medicago truncatula TaxID=3880 RepID=A0A396GJS7_MEDTR|nr:putative P-loop containing nucleoside triphosphate hydrolase [Medicago truncatula]